MGPKLAGKCGSTWNARSRSPRGGVVERLNNGDTIEVSAYFCMIRDRTGTYNGEAYNGVQFDSSRITLRSCGPRRRVQYRGRLRVGRTNSEEGEDAEPVANLDGAASAMVAVHLSPQPRRHSPGATDSPRRRGQISRHLGLSWVGPDVRITFEEAAAAVDWVASRNSILSRLDCRANSGSRRTWVRTRSGSLIEGEMLTKIHRALRNEFEWSGQPVKTHGSYIPHLTMGYIVGRFGYFAVAGR